ncbi:universal stress protein [Halorubrum laminariae]|uniref:Universal stress protein n=1 Tax=Halorubrum laminariae TaxID=1433523 RepID=A0ABD6C4P4_9EURY|nr:universal stress protein [Halorubrum laminariae]
MNGSDPDGGGADGATAKTTRTGSAITGPIIESLIEEAIAATATASHARIEGTDRLSRGDQLASILVAVGPGPHSGATVDLARAVAETTDAWLDLFHVVPDETPDAASEEPDNRDGTTAADSTADHIAATTATTGDELLSAARERIVDFECADQWLVEERTAAGAIVEQSPYYDLVVVGESTTGTVGRFVFGSTTETVADEAAVPVVVVEGDEPTPIVDD